MLLLLDLYLSIILFILLYFIFLSLIAYIYFIYFVNCLLTIKTNFLLNKLTEEVTLILIVCYAKVIFSYL